MNHSKAKTSTQERSDAKMNKKTLTKLEYDKIIDLLAEHASSFSGKERCRRLKPKISIEEIRTA